MIRSEQIQMDVLDELAYDPAVDSSGIAVTATEAGAVTLKGTVPTYMQARAAERAAKRVRGVHAVVNDIEVKPPTSYAFDDTVVAERVLRALGSSATVPKDAVQVTVSRGWVTLDGSLAWDYQRRAAYNAVRDLAGVRGVSNIIRLSPQAKPGDVKDRIEYAFRRSSRIHDQHIAVDAVGNTVTLRGTVPSWADRETAEEAAHAAAGVASVENRIQVRSPALV